MVEEVPNFSLPDWIMLLARVAHGDEFDAWKGNSNQPAVSAHISCKRNSSTSAWISFNRTLSPMKEKTDKMFTFNNLLNTFMADLGKGL